MTGSIVGNLHIVMDTDGSRLRAGFAAARRSTRTFATGTQRDLNRTTQTIERMRRSASRPMFAGGFVAASRSLQTMNQRAAFLQTSMLALTAIFGGFSAAITGNALMRYADSFTEINNRIRIVTGSTGELNAVQEQLFDISQRARTGFRETVILYGRMAIAGRQLGSSQTDLLRITETIQKAFIVGGSTTQEASSSAIQLSQGIASNRLGGDELRSVLENQALGQLLADQISDGDIGKFREMAEEGELTARVIMDAFLEASSAIDEAFTQVRPTISQSFVVLDNALMAYIGASDQASGTSELFAKSVVSLAENLNTIIPTLSAMGFALVAAFAGPKLAAIAANTAAVTRNAFAMQLATKAALDHARAEAAAATAQRAAALARVQSAQAVFATASMQASAANATTAAYTRATAASRALAAANAQLAVANRVATASQATLAAATVATTTVIGRMAAASLALVGGPVGAGLIAIAGGYFLISRAADAAGRATREHEQALTDLKSQMDIVAGASEVQQEDLRQEITLRLNAARSIYEQVRAETRRMAVAAAQMERSSPGSPVVQSLNQRVRDLDDETRIASERVADFQMLLFGFDQRMEAGAASTSDLGDALDETGTAAQRLADRLADMRLNTLAAGLGEVDRQTVSTALSFGIARDAVEAFINAAQSGSLDGVDGNILSIRNALVVQEAYATAAKVLEDLRTPMENAADYQRQLNTAVAEGALSAGQAAEAYRRYINEITNQNETLNLYKDATRGFIDDMVDGLRKGEDIWETFGNAAVNALNKIADRLIDIALDNLFANAFSGGSGGGLFTGFLGGIFGGGRGLPSFDGGGYTGRGARSGGLDGKGGFAALLHPDELVTDFSGMNVGGVGKISDPTVIIKQTNHITNPFDMAGVERAIAIGNQGVMAQVPGVSLTTVSTTSRLAPGSLG